MKTVLWMLLAIGTCGAAQSLRVQGMTPETGRVLDAAGNLLFVSGFVSAPPNDVSSPEGGPYVYRQTFTADGLDVDSGQVGGKGSVSFDLVYSATGNKLDFRAGSGVVLAESQPLTVRVENLQGATFEQWVGVGVRLHRDSSETLEIFCGGESMVRAAGDAGQPNRTYSLSATVPDIVLTYDGDDVTYLTHLTFLLMPTSGEVLTPVVVEQLSVDQWHRERLARLGDKVRPYKHPAEVHHNVVYKQIDDWFGLLDLYMPSANKTDAAPVVLYLHGGGWQGGSKEAVIPAAWKGFSELEELTKRGIAVASVDYRLCKFDLDGTTIRDCVTDCKDAMRFLVKHAERFGLDPKRIAVWGGSAGGHLAQMTVLTPPTAFPGEPDLLEFSVQPVGGVSYFGPSDFENHESFDLPTEAAYHKRWLNRLFIDGTPYEQIAEMEAKVSPVLYLKKDSPPMLFVHGNRDRTISFKQMELMQVRAEELSASMEFMTVQNAGHGWKEEIPGVAPEPSERDIVSAMVEFIVQLLSP